MYYSFRASWLNEALCVAKYGEKQRNLSRYLSKCVFFCDLCVTFKVLVRIYFKVFFVAS